MSLRMCFCFCLCKILVSSCLGQKLACLRSCFTLQLICFILFSFISGKWRWNVIISNEIVRSVKGIVLKLWREEMIIPAYKGTIKIPANQYADHTTPVSSAKLFPWIHEMKCSKKLQAGEKPGMECHVSALSGQVQYWLNLVKGLHMWLISRSVGWDCSVWCALALAMKMKGSV